MPRITSGTVPSAAAWNQLSTEIDNLGIVCKVRRVNPYYFVSTTDITIPWQQATFDTRGDMWNSTFPQTVNVQVSGSYIVAMQQRWAPTNGGVVMSGANIGRRACKIMVNGTSVFANSISSDIRSGTSDAEGVNLTTIAFVRLFAGDYIAANGWQSSGYTLAGLHTDFGGSWLTVARVAPLAV